MQLVMQKWQIILRFDIKKRYHWDRWTSSGPSASSWRTRLPKRLTRVGV